MYEKRSSIVVNNLNNARYYSWLCNITCRKHTKSSWNYML